jgi:hypothetical protein
VVNGARLAKEMGLRVHGGHGLTYQNVTPIAAIPEMEDLNIGHNIIARASMVGLERAVKEMLVLLQKAKRGRKKMNSKTHLAVSSLGGRRWWLLSLESNS